MSQPEQASGAGRLARRLHRDCGQGRQDRAESRGDRPTGPSVSLPGSLGPQGWSPRGPGQPALGGSQPVTAVDASLTGPHSLDTPLSTASRGVWLRRDRRLGGRPRARRELSTDPGAASLTRPQDACSDHLRPPDPADQETTS